MNKIYNEKGELVADVWEGQTYSSTTGKSYRQNEGKYEDQPHQNLVGRMLLVNDVAINIKDYLSYSLQPATFCPSSEQGEDIIRGNEYEKRKR